MSKATGKITHISNVQEFDSGAKKLQFVIETSETDYNGNPKLLAFDFFAGASKLEKIENFERFNKVGSSVEVDFDIDCREYKGKYYTNLSAWKVFGQSKAAPTPPPTNDYNPNEPDEGDDPPF